LTGRAALSAAAAATTAAAESAAEAAHHGGALGIPHFLQEGLNDGPFIVGCVQQRLHPRVHSLLEVLSSTTAAAASAIGGGSRGRRSGAGGWGCALRQAVRNLIQ
jgi:hypothetical protein